MKISRKRVASLVTVGVSLSLTTLFAQMSGESAKLLLAMGANAKRVVQYEWKQRITVVRKGRPAEPVVDQVRFDSTGQMQRTTISAPAQEKRGVRGRIAPSDSLVMLVNSATHLATRVDIKTDYEGGPMTITQDYGRIPGGPNMMKSMRVSVPGKDLVVNVESYDYVQQTARRN
jgi:hypothetical protein